MDSISSTRSTSDIGLAARQRSPSPGPSSLPSQPIDLSVSLSVSATYPSPPALAESSSAFTRVTFRGQSCSPGRQAPGHVRYPHSQPRVLGARLRRSRGRGRGHGQGRPAVGVTVSQAAVHRAYSVPEFPTIDFPFLLHLLMYYFISFYISAPPAHGHARHPFHFWSQIPVSNPTMAGLLITLRSLWWLLICSDFTPNDTTLLNCYTSARDDFLPHFPVLHGAFTPNFRTISRHIHSLLFSGQWNAFKAFFTEILWDRVVATYTRRLPSWDLPTWHGKLNYL